MHITKTEIYRYSIPMTPFTIATGTMHEAQNVFIRIHTSEGFVGVGECSAFPMITGETQSTCFAMAKDFAAVWKDKNPLEIKLRMKELHQFTAYNYTAKSAFDMALYDIAAQHAGKPLYRFLGGKLYKPMETDLTIGIDTPAKMAEKAADYVKRGVRIIKIKLGKDVRGDIARVRQIRKAAGDEVILRVDANQGWDFENATKVLNGIAKYKIQFCEQPMDKNRDHLLPILNNSSPVRLMADESVFTWHDAVRLIRTLSCAYMNIKFAKTGGILEALEINNACERFNIGCMMGGMLESRVALTAFAHFAAAKKNVMFYDMDTALLGHKIDPVTRGVEYDGFFLRLPKGNGIGADVDESFLKTMEKAIV